MEHLKFGAEMEKVGEQISQNKNLQINFEESIMARTRNKISKIANLFKFSAFHLYQSKI